MAHEDEKIAAMRNAERKKRYNSIESGVYAGDELLRFAECRLFGDRMSIMLPDSFTDMSPEDARMKYPSENRPQVIKTNADGTVNFTFSILSEHVTPQSLNNTLETLHLCIKSAQPANLFLSFDSIQNDDITIEWFAFKCYTLDGTIFNILFITSIQEQLMLGMFNCPNRAKGVWEPIATQLFTTVREIKS